MENKLLTFSSSPHVKSPRTTKGIMISVCIALLPACIMGVIYFGLNAFLLLAISLISAVASEVVYLLICKKPFKQIMKEVYILFNIVVYSKSANFAIRTSC